MLFKRLSVFICPLLLFIGLEAIFFAKQNLQLIIILLSSLLIILTLFLKSFIKEKFFSRYFWNLAILPILFYIFFSIFLIILGWGPFRHILLAIFALIMGIYLENIFLFYYDRIYYEPDSLENSSLFLNILCFFLLALNLNSLSIFLNLPLWLSSIILVALMFVLLKQLFWVLKVKNFYYYIYLFIAVVIILEFFWVMSFLPANFYVFSIILTVIYYFILGIFKEKLLNKLDRKLLLRYLAISVILIFIALFTASWS